MKFLITDNEGVKELLCISKKKQRVKLKYHHGYNEQFVGKVSCELQDTGDEVLVNIEDKEITLDYAQVDYLRKVLNAWDKHLNSTWLSEEERKESIYKLKKGRK